MRRKVVLIHIGVTSTLVGGLALLYKFADRGPSQTLYHTVHLTALMVVVAFFYYLLFEIFRRVSPQRWGLRRRHTGQAYSVIEARGYEARGYEARGSEARGSEAREEQATRGAAGKAGGRESDPEGAQSTASDPLLSQLRIPDRPRLSMASVCWLVYGLGFVFFVTLYCLSGQQAICSYFFGVGLSCLCIDELMAPLASSPFAGRVRLLEVMAVALAFAGVVLAGVGTIMYDETRMQWPLLDIFSVTTGFFLPLLAPITLYGLKDSQAYYTGDMLELCEFGLPFMFILGCGFIVSADAQSVRLVGSMGGLYNLSSVTGGGLADGADPGGLVALLVVGPLLAVPALVFITTASLRGHASDPLIAFALVIAGQYLLERGEFALGDPVGLSAVSAVQLALIARLASTSDALNGPPPESKAGAPAPDPLESA